MSERDARGPEDHERAGGPRSRKSRTSCRTVGRANGANNDAFSRAPGWAKSPAMTGHALFIWSSYAAAFVGLAGLLAVSLLDRRRVRREVAERGLDRKR